MNGEPQFAAGPVHADRRSRRSTCRTECGGEAGWNEEETLDVQAVHGMAPGANIHYVGAMNCDTGIDDAVNYVIQNHVANIVSNSYGFIGEDGLGDEVATEHSLFTQAAIQGIGFYFSSGDYGDNTDGRRPAPGAGLPGLGPAGHRRRWHEPRRHAVEQLPVRDLVGQQPLVDQHGDVARRRTPRRRPERSSPVPAAA